MRAAALLPTLLVLAAAGCLAPGEEPPSDATPADPATSETLVARGRFSAAAEARAGERSFSFMTEGESVFDVPLDAESYAFNLSWTSRAGPGGAIEVSLAEVDGYVVGRATGESPLRVLLAEGAFSPGATTHILAQPAGPAGASPPLDFEWEATFTLDRGE